MSILSYNGLTFPCNQTTKFDCVSQYDPMGSVDWICTTYTISAVCLIHLKYLDVIVASMPAGAEKTFILNSGNAAAILRSMKNIFMRPRKQLNFIVNGVDQIPSVVFGNAGTVDARNGPIPKRFDFSFVTSESILLNIQVQADYWENQLAAGSSVINNTTCPVMYNRWEETVRIDDYDLSTRTRTGSYAIRSDNSQGKIADQLRNDFAILAIPPGFLRTRREYKQSPDGLSIHYTIEDKEQKRMPPLLYEPPGIISEAFGLPILPVGVAFHSKVTYKETTGNALAVRYGSCVVTLVGGRATTATSLAYTAIGIAVNRVIVATDFKIGGPNTFIPLGSSFAHDRESNTVQFSINVQYKQIRSRTAGIIGFTNQLALDPISPNLTGIPPYLDRGTAGLLIQAAAYYDPDIVNNKVSKKIPPEIPKEISLINPGSQMSVGKIPGQAGKDGE